MRRLRRPRRQHTGHAPRAVAARPVSTEPLESRLLMSAALKLGGSGYSGTLSSNPVTRQQQLICDPVEPASGSTSVQYDAELVTLRPIVVGEFFTPIVEPGPGYQVTDVQIEVREFDPETESYSDPFLIGTGSFLDSFTGQYQETGYVQVKFALDPESEVGPGQITPSGVVLDEEGVEGVDPFALNFNPLYPPPGPILTITDGGGFAAAAAAADGEPVVSYKIYADTGTHGNAPDFLVVNDPPDFTVIPAEDLSPAFVSANDPVTLDATTGTGGPYTITEGDDLELHGNASRGSASADQIRYQWDIGNDGTIDAEGQDATVSAADLQLLGYDAPTTVPVKLIAGGGTSQATALTTLTIQESSGARLVDDPALPGQKAFAVTGTNDDDLIRFSKVPNGLAVTIKTGADVRNFGPFPNASFNRVFAFGKGGDDDIAFLTRLPFFSFDRHFGAPAAPVHPAVFFGGAGNDVLLADDGASILDGGDGIDLIYGGTGRDLLVGGRGSDLIGGGNGDDILVGGRTSYDEGSDDDIRALTAVVNAWNGTGSYEQRITRVKTTTTFVQNTFDDGKTDLLLGGDGRDWLIYHRGPGADDLTDLARNETGTIV